MEFDLDGPSGPLQIALVVILGLGVIGYGAYSYTSQNADLDSAASVEATVVSTSVETSPQRRGTAYHAQATFNYTYDGETYTSSRVYPGELPREFDSKRAAREALGGYEPGSTVTAYVPAGAPQNAFLKHERSNKPFFVMGFGGLFVLVGVYSALKELYR
jgi:hypothetical protein